VIVLDTHAWLWWLSSPELLSAAARKAVDHAMADDGIAVSSISAWEVAVLVKKGRLELTMPAEDWIARSEALPFLKFVPVDNRIALRSISLPGHLNDDPADRIIVATTLSLGGTLVTKDDKIRKYPHVRTVW
jgi:PIN domain nuclease of toxin-antitoxin system